MATTKIYAGVKLREVRVRFGLTQREFAERLGISLPYLNQMENNNRPVSTAVVLALAQEFGLDVTELQADDEARLISDLREAMADPILTGPSPPLADLRLMASNAPALAHAVLALHGAYRQSHERLAALDAVLGDGQERPAASPWEEVRDFFHYCDNYLDAVDRAAERMGGEGGAAAARAAEAELAQHGVTVALGDAGDLRRYDPQSGRLTLSRQAPEESRRFQLMVQLGLLTQEPLFEATLDLARFRSPEARAIAHLGLANYFAGAALMPYARFMEAAATHRHDLEILAERFGASLEQVAHRLATLQRPGAKGVPFFFVRVDQSGTITKRHSATRLQFARYGGACPLWNVHSAFETPGRWLRQWAETPDGVRYFCLARDVSKPAGAWGAPVRRFAIGLGCEIRHAAALVYADRMDPGARFEPIGISCRICERKNCHQRAVPPLERGLTVDPRGRGALPYQVD